MKNGKVMERHIFETFLITEIKSKLTAMKRDKKKVDTVGFRVVSANITPTFL